MSELDVDNRDRRDRSGRAHELATDEALVDRVLAGDEEALTALYRRHVGPIYRFVLAQVRSTADAEDLTSETFARMMRGLSRFRGEAAFRNWLYQIARNAVRNHRRQEGYRRSVPISRTMASPEAAPDEADRAGASPSAAILELLGRLPPRYRQVLELRFLEGRTIDQTAVEMGVTVGNAKVLQHRALRRAATVLEEKAVESRSD